MNSTRASLLIRVRDRQDTVSWREFHELYSPLIYHFARARNLNHDDAEEIRSSCFETIVNTIGDFEYTANKGGFKAWLRKMVLNRVIDLKRKRATHQMDSNELAQIPGRDLDGDQAFEDQWKLSHLGYCLERVKSKVPEKTFQAFTMLTDGIDVRAVCESLGMNANQVYKAKSRILKLVREQMNLVYGEEPGDHSTPQPGSR